VEDVERFRPRRYTVCSRRCATLARQQVRHEAEAEARVGKTCPVCGEVFDATRRDAVTCRPACRQKAYRRRAQPAAGEGEG
jgi:hypothetical protein